MPTLQEQATDSLIERVRQGSLSAMNRLIASGRMGLRRMAEARLPRAIRRKEDLSDLIQKCLCKGVLKFGRFKGRSRGAFQRWLYKILENDIRKQRRFWAQKKRDQRLEEPLAPDGGVARGPAGSTASPLGRLVRKEEFEQLMVALDWCLKEERDVILQHCLADRSYAEIAADQGISCDAVRKRFSRALPCIRKAKRLQTLMTEYGMSDHQQEVVGIHLFQGLDAATIAVRLELSEWLVETWLDEARPLIRKLDEDKP